MSPPRTGAFGGNPGSGRATHGTQSGYVTHRRYGEKACPACRTAHMEFVRAQRRHEVGSPFSKVGRSAPLDIRAVTGRKVRTNGRDWPLWLVDHSLPVP